jgi:hypothetical protein
MNSDDGLHANTDLCGGVMSLTYDYCGEPKPLDSGTIHVNLMGSTAEPGIQANRGSVEPSAAPRQAGRAISEHTFEFRLSGSERQEQSWPGGVAAAIVAIRRVRTYLTRHGEPAEATSAIGGVEVRAERRGADILAPRSSATSARATWSSCRSRWGSSIWGSERKSFYKMMGNKIIVEVGNGSQRLCAVRLPKGL